MLSVESGDARLSVTARGDGAPLVFLHGLTWDRRQSEELTSCLDERVFVYDARGCRGSGGRELTLERMTDDLEAVADTVSPDDPLVVGGISVGAAVSFLYALRRPARVRRLVQVAPGFDERGMAPGARRFVGACADAVERGGFDSLRGLVEPAEVQRWEGMFDAPGLVALWRGVLAGRVSPLDSYGGPALVVAWRGDELHPFEIAESCARRLPGARLVDVPHGGAVDGAAVCAAIREFLN